MIRTYNKQTVVVENGVTKYLADIFCNSTDTKPTANLVNGSKLTEVDTGKTYLYDEANTEWVEYAEGGGGGGSTSGGVGVITTIVSGNSRYFYECTNPDALQYVLTYDDGHMKPVQYDSIEIFAVEITSDMGAVTFDENGSPVPLVGEVTLCTIGNPYFFTNGEYVPLSDETDAQLVQGGIVFVKETGKAIFILGED